MIIAVPKEILPGENRVSITPDVVSKLIKAGYEIHVEKDAGIRAGFTNKSYEAAGAKLFDSVVDLYFSADIILKVQRPLENNELNKNELELFKKGQLLITFFYPLYYPGLAKKCAERGINVISMDFIPRTSLAQRMDALSSQANLAGYKSVLLAANSIGKIFPMMMTAAGTVPAARVFIMGVGVAGLQAIATAKRLGAIVTATDVRPSTKEQVESLAAKFIAVEDEEFKKAETSAGYAREMSAAYKKKQAKLIAEHVSSQDIIVTTALIPGRPAPELISRAMVESMKPGSFIVDLAAERGGNCAVTKADRTVEHKGVSVMGPTNLAGELAGNASSLYARNLHAFIALMIDTEKKGELAIDWDDDVIKGTLAARGGKLVHPMLVLAKGKKGGGKK